MFETKEQLKDGTLKWCNKIRAEQKMEPLTELPKGIMGDPLTCPCGAATGKSVGLVIYGDPDNDADNQPLPPIVIDFISEFDHGNIPELIDKGNAEA